MPIEEILKVVAGGLALGIVAALKPLINKATANDSKLMDLVAHNTTVEALLVAELNDCREELAQLKDS